MIWELSNGYTPETTPNQPLLQAVADEMLSFNKKINIVPEPVKMELLQGSFSISPSDQICIGTKHPELSKHANYLSSVIESLSGNKLKISNSLDKASIKFIISETALIGKEGYHLNIDQKGITISANTDKGIFYGIQTLLQTIHTYRPTKPLLHLFLIILY